MRLDRNRRHIALSRLPELVAAIIPLNAGGLTLSGKIRAVMGSASLFSKNPALPGGRLLPIAPIGPVSPWDNPGDAFLNRIGGEPAPAAGAAAYRAAVSGITLPGCSGATAGPGRFRHRRSSPRRGEKARVSAKRKVAVITMAGPAGKST